MLRFPKPPAAVASEAVNGLSRFYDRSDPERGALASAESTAAHFVWVLGLQPLLDSDLTLHQAAVPVGWQFLILAEQSGPRASYITVPSDSGAPRLTSVLHGSRLSYYFEITKSIQEVYAASPELAARDYQVRMLKIPCLLTEAFWLVPIPDGASRIVPVRSSIPNLAPENPTDIPAFQVLPVADFLERCRPYAESQLGEDRRQGRDGRYGWQR
jgi:hypothetical protein